jgi:hypothetical protein
MGDWEPDETAKTGASEIYLWVVPAKVAGRWRVDVGDGAPFELALEQRYQRVTGRVSGGGPAPRLQGVRLGGSEIRLALAGAGGERALTGRVDGDRIEGAAGGWRAVRLKPG